MKSFIYQLDIKTNIQIPCEVYTFEDLVIILNNEKRKGNKIKVKFINYKDLHPDIKLSVYNKNNKTLEYLIDLEKYFELSKKDMRDSNINSSITENFFKCIENEDFLFELITKRDDYIIPNSYKENSDRYIKIKLGEIL